MTRTLRLLYALTLVCSTSAYGDWTYNPGTGHYYRATDSHGTWAQANAEALSAGGYLTTINDGAENSWLTQFAADLYRRSGAIPNQGNLAWIGYRDAGAGFGWENGESSSYTNLAAGCTEWGSYSGIHAYIHGANHDCPGRWNHNPIHDTVFDENLRGIIERDTVLPAVPAVSELGLSMLGLLTLTAGTLVLRRRMPAS